MSIYLLFLILISGWHGTALAGSSISNERLWDFPDRAAAPEGALIDKQISSDGDGSFSIISKGKSVVTLYTLENPEIGNTRAVFRAMLKTEDLESTGSGSNGIAYLEMRVQLPDGSELVSRGPRMPPSGTSDWSAAETFIYLDSGQHPASVSLNLVVDGAGRVWIDDLSFRTRPLRLGYLFWGHIVVWVLLILYIIDLLRKNRRLRSEIDSLNG